jgi:hypothetical protein
MTGIVASGDGSGNRADRFGILKAASEEELKKVTIEAMTNPA